MTFKQGMCLKEEDPSCGLCSRESFNLLLESEFLNTGNGTWFQAIVAAWLKFNRVDSTKAAVYIAVVKLI